MRNKKVGKQREDTEVKFTKMHGCGNDYIYVYTGDQDIAPEERGTLSRKFSDRHKGIGGDGIIYINPTDEADFEMEMYNADGSKGAMCGNGIRCVGKFVYDHGLTDKKSLKILTGAGIKTLELKISKGKAVGATVNMGKPILEAGKIPVKIKGYESTDQVIGAPLEVSGEEYRITCVSMGNPHCVIFTDKDLRTLELEKTGPLFEKHPAFPDRVNTEFIRLKNRTEMDMRVWERGSGETMACGTGACASLAAGVLNGICDRRAKVNLIGGELEIEWSEEDGCIYMTGPAETVFEGVVE